jgi:hypothetical protein
MRPPLAKAKRKEVTQDVAPLLMSSLHHEQAKKKATERKSGTLKSRRLLATVVLTMLAAAVVIALPAIAAPQPLATLLQANLTTAKPGPGDPDGYGNATVLVYKKKVCYTLAVTGIEPATLAHIHKGVKGQTGPVVVPTDPNQSFNPPRDVSSGCERIPSSLSADLRQNPTNYYVNVHNTQYPEGAIRGQLLLTKGM